MTTIRHTLALALVLLLTQLCAHAQNGRFTCATMNVDGLPPSIDVNIFGNHTININPDAREEAGATAIAQKIIELGADFIGVNEDFNYHAALMAPLTPQGYVAYTHRGGMSVSEAGGTALALINFLAKKPLVRADGLNLICHRQPWDGYPRVSATDEKIVAWNDAYGYTEANHDNDALTTKGFRYYRLTLADTPDTPVDIDVYILHMDAGTGWADGDDGDILAREKQMAQLCSYIENRTTTRPIIIMGDFNSYYTRDRLQQLLVDPLNAWHNGQLTVNDCWVEQDRGGIFPTYDLALNGYNGKNGEAIDKILYVNNSASPVRLVLEHFRVGRDFTDANGAALSDHYPSIARFAYYAAPVTVGTLTHTIRDIHHGRATTADLDRETQALLRGK